ncbi:monovalent cation/H+ antiporter subunit D family protein [Robiginitomaculum antarcticum]|uniref:monovalent cation/H+ antiporter subunit D family protein n=1 Tax=Robiginitomaculum antarcticum TaxID=437507 RepID=UPI00036C8BF0|nr:monovalent cation/H+ antiporter subunit D family protein [Robiginitomaculum antarcticum]
MSTFLTGWLSAEAPVLIVVLPLVMAAFCAVMPKDKIAWIITLITTLICAVLAFDIVLQVQSAGVLSYALGGWDPPFGIEYRIDGLNAPVVLLISAIGVICTLYALRSTDAEIEPKKRAPFYAAFLVAFAGLLGMVVTGDAFNVFVFLEVSSISTYVLVAMGASRDRRALNSAYNYLILGSIGATFFVIGVGFLYMETGTLNMMDMADQLAVTADGSRVAQLAFAFIVVGLGLKLAMFPLHLWLPGAYAYAPTAITAFLAATATKAALYLLLRFVFTVFDPSLAFIGATLTWLLAVLGVVGMFVASFQAIFQTDARRVLAYSSVAQIGYILLGVGMGTTLGVSAGYVHLINHGIIKGALFLALGAFWYRYGIKRVSDFNGLGKLMPWTMSAFTIAALALIGIPGTAGFVSKFQLLTAAADNGWWWAVGAVVVTSILAVIYMGRMLEAAWLQPAPLVNGKPVASREAPWPMMVGLWVLAIASLVFGIMPAWPLELASGAAQVMLGGGL